ncbi:MAG: helix-turn-helix domain-containing protein [Nitrososphaera sp.]|nr:helix-turn-helix domain-containing protein [Nitrososphaera sp.]
MTKTAPEKFTPEELNAFYLRAKHKVLSELQRAYLASGMTQKEIAERLDMSEAYISRCLRGHKNMTVRTMSNIARGMDCRLDLSVTRLDTLSLRNHPLDSSWQRAREEVVATGGQNSNDRFVSAA